ncbi:hypothetical protein B9Z55_011223 [Caenorhabditis nigoni]|nr:hypothetical protein B9Z55_011223 [Caenorhabditis nigoni]
MSYAEQEEQRDHNIQLVRENKGKKPELYRCEYPEKDNSICSFVGVHAAINEHFFQHTGAYSIQCMICNRYFGGKLEFHHHRKVCGATTSKSRPIHKPFFQVENDAELRSIFIRPATEEEKKEAKGADGFFNWSSRVERPNFNNNAWDGYHHLNESEKKNRERNAARHSDNIRKRHGREPSPVRDSGSSSIKRYRYETDGYRKRRRSRSSSGSPENRHRSSRGSGKVEGSRRSENVPEATTNGHHGSESTSDVSLFPPKRKKTEMNIPLELAAEVPQQTLEIAIPPPAETENPVFFGLSEPPDSERLTQESQSDLGTSDTSSSSLIVQGAIQFPAVQPETKGAGLSSPSVRTPTSHSEVSSAMAQPDENSGLVSLTKEPASTVAKDPAATVSKDSAATVTDDPAATVSKDSAATVTDDPAATVSKDSAATVTEDPKATVIEDPSTTVTEDPKATGTDEPAATVTEDPFTTVIENPAATVTEDTETVEESSVEVITIDDSESDSDDDIICLGNFRSEPAKSSSSTQTNSLEMMAHGEPALEMPVKTGTVENGPRDSGPSEPSTPRENLLAKNSEAPMIRFLNTSGREIGSMMPNGDQGTSDSSRSFSNVQSSSSALSCDVPVDQRQEESSSASPSKNRYSSSMPYEQRMLGSSSGSIEANGTIRNPSSTTAAQDPTVRSSESSANQRSSAPQPRRPEKYLQNLPVRPNGNSTVLANPPGTTPSMTFQDDRGNYNKRAEAAAKVVPTRQTSQPTILVNTSEETPQGNGSSSAGPSLQPRPLQRPSSFPVNLKPPEEFINNNSRNYLIPATLKPRKKSELPSLYDANSPSNCVAVPRSKGDTRPIVPPPVGYEPEPLESPETFFPESSVVEEETSDQEVRWRWNEMIKNREPTNMNENEAETSDANLTSSDTNDSEEASEGSPAPETSRHMSRESPSPEPMVPMVHQSRQESSTHQLLSPGNLVPRTYSSSGFLLQKPPLPRTVPQQIPSVYQQSTLQRTMSSGSSRVPESVRKSPGNINLPIRKPPGAKENGTSSQSSIPMNGNYGRAAGVTHRIPRDSPPVQTVFNLTKVARKRRADQEAANIKNGQHG